MYLQFKAAIRNIKQSRSNHIYVFQSYRDITDEKMVLLFLILIQVLQYGNFSALYFSSLKCLLIAPILKQVATSSSATIIFASTYVLQVPNSGLNCFM